MKTKKSNTPRRTEEDTRDNSKETTENAAPMNGAEGTAQEEGAGGKNRFNLSFDLDASGKPDLSSMRERTKERAKEFFSDPRMAEAFGVKPNLITASAGANYFPTAPGEKYPAVIGSMYNMIGTIEAIAAQRFGKIPEPIARQVFTYTEMEKEALAAPTVRVLNKYMPEWLIKYQDEIALANMLVAMTVAKVNAATMLAKTMQVPSAPEPKKEGEGTTTQPN